MKIGYLRAGFAPRPLQSRFGDYSNIFLDFFTHHLPEARFGILEVRRGEVPEKIEDFDAYLCCGASESIYDPLPWIDGLLATIRRIHRSGRPYVGICFGHQALAQALGGEVRRAPNGWGMGAHGIDLHRCEPWMDPSPEPLRLNFSHQDQVLAIPAGGTVLGAAPHCPCAMFQVDGHMLGIQGHPEFSPEFMRAMIELRRGRIGEDVARPALESLERPVDNARTGAWISRFFRRYTAHGGSHSG